MRYRRRRIARRTAELIELGRELTDADVLLETDCAGPAYGLPGEGTLDAIRVCARQEGMLTDPVYEGKSMHGMIDMVRSGKLPQGSRVLYAHLGGVPTSDWDDSVGIDNPGQSGNVDSPHYRDLYPLWARGRYFPIFFSAPKVRSVTESRLVLEPARPQ